jgi:hypothetical protein
LTNIRCPWNWAPLEPFELLGEDFDLAYPLADNDALAAFEALKRTPEFFRRYLGRYLAYADLGAKAALIDTEAHVFKRLKLR